MALTGFSFQYFNGTGSLAAFVFAFDFISTAHVLVDVGGVTQATSVYSINEGTKTLTFTGGNEPASGTSNVKIYRVTPKNTADRIVDFEDASVLTASDLDTSALQLLYIAQEAEDTGSGSLPLDVTDDSYDAETYSIKNLTTGTNSTDAVTKGYVDSLALYNATSVPQSFIFTTVTDQTNYTLTGTNSNVDEMYVVSIDGVVQVPGVGKDFIVQNGILKFSPAPPGSRQLLVLNFGIARTVFDSPLKATAHIASQVPITIKGAGSQTANLLEIRNHTDVLKASIDADGDIAANDVTAAGNVAVTGSISGAAVSGTTGTFTGAVSGTTGTFTGAVAGASTTITGDVGTATVTATGAITGAAITGTTGTFSGDVTTDDLTAATVTSGTVTIDGSGKTTYAGVPNVPITGGVVAAGTVSVDNDARTLAAGSFNVGSVAPDPANCYFTTIIFATPLADANYIVVATYEALSVAGIPIRMQAATRTTTQFQITHEDDDVGDHDFHFVVFKF